MDTKAALKKSIRLILGGVTLSTCLVTLAHAQSDVSAEQIDTATEAGELSQPDSDDLETTTAPPATIDADLYFDAQDLIPESELATKGGARRVDPEAQPASSFVVIEKGPAKNSVPALMVAAKRAGMLGRYQAAADIYSGILEKTPKDQQALLGYAVALQHLKRSDEAISTYEKLLEVDPENTDAHINMLGLVGEKFPAVALQRLLILQKKQAHFSAPLTGQIAYVQSRLGLYEDALNNLAILASSEPENAGHLLNMAVTADKAGMQSEAVKYYEKALEIDTVYNGGRSVNRSEIFDRLARLR